MPPALPFTAAQLRHQPGDIDEHALRIVNATNLPADRCFRSTAVIIGPTAVDFNVLRPIGDPAPTPADLAARKAKRRAVMASKRAAFHRWAASVNRTTTGPQVPRAFDVASHLVKPKKQTNK